MSFPVIGLNNVLQTVTAIAVVVSAYYGYHNNQLAHSNSQKLDPVKVAADGAQHALATTIADSQTKSEDLILTIATAAVQKADHS